MTSLSRRDGSVGVSRNPITGNRVPFEISDWVKTPVSVRRLQPAFRGGGLWLADKPACNGIRNKVTHPWWCDHRNESRLSPDHRAAICRFSRSVPSADEYWMTRFLIDSTFNFQRTRCYLTYCICKIAENLSVEKYMQERKRRRRTRFRRRRITNQYYSLLKKYSKAFSLLDLF